MCVRRLLSVAAIVPVTLSSSASESVDGRAVNGKRSYEEDGKTQEKASPSQKNTKKHVLEYLIAIQNERKGVRYSKQEDDKILRRIFAPLMSSATEMKRRIRERIQSNDNPAPYLAS